MDFSKLLHRLYLDFSMVVKLISQIDTWTCQCWYVELLKLVHGFVKVDLYNYRPLPNKTKLKFDCDCKAC